MTNNSSTSANARPVRDQTFGPPRWGWSLKLPPNEKLVLFALFEFDHIDRETHQRKGIVWPTQETLAEMTGLTDRTIRRCLKSLEAKQIVARTGAYAKDGGAVHYRLLYPFGPDVVSASSEQFGPDTVSVSNASGPDFHDIRSGHCVLQTTNRKTKATPAPLAALVPRAPHENKLNSAAPLVLADARTRSPRESNFDNVETCGASVPIDGIGGGEAADPTCTTDPDTVSGPYCADLIDEAKAREWFVAIKRGERSRDDLPEDIAETVTSEIDWPFGSNWDDEAEVSA